MALSYFISITIVFALNVLFFFSGVCLNSLVILSFWRSVQLRKKLCYFMIMVLSCCDFLAVLVNHPLSALTAMLWLTGKLGIYENWMNICGFLANVCLGCSLIALLVMNFDRYLATSHPLFHRASVTKERLLILFVIITISAVSLTLLTVLYDSIISFAVFLLICFIVLLPSMLYINYKLFTIARKSRRNNAISPETKKTTLSLKNISSCLLVVASVAVLSIPVFVYVAIRIIWKTESNVLNDSELTALWARTFSSMNCTFNCLIFYWKDRLLRAEGMKIVKGAKICRRIPSQSGLDSHAIIEVRGVSAN